jgi:hypothetical protein
MFARRLLERRGTTRHPPALSGTETGEVTDESAQTDTE